jgi:N-formylglutamate amidohydrolase
VLNAANYTRLQIEKNKHQSQQPVQIAGEITPQTTLDVQNIKSD